MSLELQKQSAKKPKSSIFNDLRLKFASKCISSYLGKYIYLQPVEPSNRDKKDLIWRSNKNFHVYILTTSADKLPNSTQEQSDIQQKQEEKASTSKNEPQEVVKDKTSMPKVGPSKSKIPVSVKKSKSNSKTSKSNENLKSSLKTSKNNSLQNISNSRNKEEMESKSNRGYELFRKLIGLPKSHQSNNASLEELFIREFSFGGSKNTASSSIAKPHKSDCGGESTLIPVSNTPVATLFLDYTMAEAMREMVEMASKIQESEIRVKDVIKKYIFDRNLENDLLSMIAGHEKLLLDTSRRALNITNDAWFQQIDIYKEQQKSMQSTIQSIVLQNRELHTENEQLLRKNEKLCNKLVMLQESSVHRTPTAVTGALLEDMSKHNDKLRMKMNLMNTRNEELEESLKAQQRKNQLLQQQLNSSNIQLSNFKVIYERSKADYDLEVAKLVKEIQESSSLQKETAEAGDILLQDFDCVKQQLKGFNFQREGNSAPELIHFCRKLTNALSKELVLKENDLDMCAKDIETLKSVIENQKIINSALEQDKASLQQNLTCMQKTEDAYNILQEKCKEISLKLQQCEQIGKTKDNELQIKEATIKAENENFKQLQIQINVKDAELARLRDREEKLEQEIGGLRAQINGMAQVLSASGTGEIAKELAGSQEKLTQIQALHLSIVAEKSFMAKQLEENLAERDTLLAYQKTCYEKLQMATKDVEILGVANKSLKEELEKEKHTVIVLQNQRMHCLEERSVLIAFFERLRMEVMRMSKLEGDMLNMNQKAEKLARIAKFNKEFGENLKHVVAEKDVAINYLQSNVKQLSDMNLASIKEKAALSEELTQLSTIKDILNAKLEEEMKKSGLIVETKKELQSLIKSQMQDTKHRYEKERNARKSLSKELKIALQENRQLLSANEKLNTKVQEVEEIQEGFVREICLLKSANEELIIRLNQDATPTMDITQVTKEKDELAKTVEYLQANINKLRIDADKARNDAKSYEKLLEQRDGDYKYLEECSRNKMKDCRAQLKDADEKYGCLLKTYDKLYKDFNLLSDDTLKFQMLVSEKFPTPQSSQQSYIRDISLRDEEIINLQEKLRNVEKEKENYSALIDELSAEKEKIIFEKQSLQADIHELDTKYKERLQQISELEELLEATQKRLQEFCIQLDEKEQLIPGLEKKIKQLEDDISDNKIKVQSESNRQIKNLQAQTAQLSEDLEESKAKLENEAQLKARLLRAYKDVAVKLMKAVKLLIFEKTQLHRIKEEVRQLSEDKKILQEQIDLCKKAGRKPALQRISLPVNSFESGNGGKSLEVERREYEERLAQLKAQLDERCDDISRLMEEMSLYESKFACLEFQKCESVLRHHETQGKLHCEKERSEELMERLKSLIKLLVSLKDSAVINEDIYNIVINAVHDCCA